MTHADIAALVAIIWMACILAVALAVAARLVWQRLRTPKPKPAPLYTPANLVPGAQAKPYVHKVLKRYPAKPTRRKV